MKNLLVIGCGRMAKVMLNGWLQSDTLLQNLSISVVSPNSAKQLPSHSHLSTYSCVEELPSQKTYDCLVVAIKPQKLREVLPCYQHWVTSQTFILTFAAGVCFREYHNILSSDVPLVRALPNTPCEIGQGVTLSVASPKVSDEQKAFVLQLLESTGLVEEMETERLLDVGMLVSSCAPAYIALLAEVMQSEAVALGINPHQAKTLVEHTLLGTASLIQQSDLTAETLRKQVCSPGGTTLEVLNPLLDDQTGLQSLFKQGFQKGLQRAQELSVSS